MAEISASYGSGGHIGSLKLSGDGFYVCDIFNGITEDGCGTFEGAGVSRGAWKLKSGVLTFQPTSDDSKLVVQVANASARAFEHGLVLTWKEDVVCLSRRPEAEFGQGIAGMQSAFIAAKFKPGESDPSSLRESNIELWISINSKLRAAKRGWLFSYTSDSEYLQIGLRGRDGQAMLDLVRPLLAEAGCFEDARSFLPLEQDDELQLRDEVWTFGD